MVAITDYGWGHLEAHPALFPIPLAELHSQHHIAAQPTRGTAEVTQPNPQGDVAWEFTLPHLHKTILRWVARGLLDKELCKFLSTTRVPHGKILRA